MKLGFKKPHFSKPHLKTHFLFRLFIIREKKVWFFIRRTFLDISLTFKKDLHTPFSLQKLALHKVTKISFRNAVTGQKFYSENFVTFIKGNAA